MKDYIQTLPKAELHLHIEGTFEPELMFKIAERNNVKLKYEKVEELKDAYNFNNLQEFLNLYYQGANVLLSEEDFFDLTYAYFKKANEQNIKHAEIFFDPQTHTNRGVDFDIVISGIHKATEQAKKDFGISSYLIMCFLRDLSEDSAFDTLNKALPYKDKIIGVGLDSAEVGNEPKKFENVFKKAIEHGFLTVAHAGEEGPSEYVWGALNYLDVSRIDHGNNSLHDESLINHLVEKKIPLTVCPLSNLKLKVVKDLKKHPLREMISKNMFVTINSDDPAYFGGYINENFLEISDALNLTKDEITKLAKNSFEASFLPKHAKNEYIKSIDEYYLTGN